MIIIGLGNPGTKYTRTRHNVGFMVLDELAKSLNLNEWQEDYSVAFVRFGDHLLLKPLGFMNTSGQTLRNFFTRKHLPLTLDDSIVVVHDDLDFPIGELHVQQDRSAGGHNGIESMIDAFGTKSFRRFRIGIGDNREQSIPAETYVLQEFAPLEYDAIRAAIKAAVDRLKSAIA